MASRGRPKLDRNQALKEYVNKLQEVYPTLKYYTRKEIEELEAVHGYHNQLGKKLFTSSSSAECYGKITRLSHGQYIIPVTWLNGKAPWNNE